MMIQDFAQTIKGHRMRRGAYLFFSEGESRQKEVVYYSQEAWRIFSYAALDKAGETAKPAFPDIGKLCRQWKKAMDAEAPSETENKKEEEFSQAIDLYQSGGRRYLIRGVFLSTHRPDRGAASSQPAQYLFLLERILPGRINLPMIGRKWRLSPRELSIIQFLIMDRSNKQIADSLGISINTLKGYLKLLMRKLHVGSRAGIVASVLTGRGPGGAEPVQDQE
jgi:DNA-binding CsgD family transcriptional regulator